MAMRVFVAGGAGAVGQRLVPQLVARGHQVTATTTGPAKLELLAQLGAEGVVMDGLDAESVGEAVAKARPDAIVHEMTGLSAAHAGKPDMRRFDRWFATTNRLRTEGTDHLLAAAEATGVSPFVAQSYAGWNGIRKGGWVKTEEDPLDPETGTGFSKGAEAIRHVEDVVLKAGGAILRHGTLYGPGALDLFVEPLRKRQFPLIGGGTGYSSWTHLEDAASAAVLAVEKKGEGRVQHRRRRTGPGQRVAAVSGGVRGGEAPDAGPQVAGPAAGRGRPSDDDDRGARLLQRQGQARARLEAALPLVASGLQGSVGMTRLDRGVPLDVGIELGQKGAQIIGIPRLDGALDGLDVLLRHRPLSTPRSPPKTARLSLGPWRLGLASFRSQWCSSCSTRALRRAAASGSSRR
jgi:nucleoside-diphosphate-sugar epimerase